MHKFWIFENHMNIDKCQQIPKFPPIPKVQARWQCVARTEDQFTATSAKCVMYFSLGCHVLGSSLRYKALCLIIYGRRLYLNISSFVSSPLPSASFQ